MTAMNLIVQEKVKAAFLLTDTAYYNVSDGAVSYLGPKVTGVSVGDDAYVAVATSGTMFANHIRSQIQAAEVSTLRAFLAAFPDIFRTAEEASQAEGGKGEMAAAIVVFDRARQRAGGFMVGNSDWARSNQCTPYRLAPCKKHLTEMGEQNDWMLEQIDFCDGSAWRPEQDGVTLMEAQRRDLFDLSPGVRAPAVGGQAILTRVDGSGISHSVLKTWPDRVGQPIDLSAGDQLGWRDRLRAWGRETLRPVPTLHINPARHPARW